MTVVHILAKNVLQNDLSLQFCNKVLQQSPQFTLLQPECWKHMGVQEW